MINVKKISIFILVLLLFSFVTHSYANSGTCAHGHTGPFSNYEVKKMMCNRCYRKHYLYVYVECQACGSKVLTGIHGEDCNTSGGNGGSGDDNKPLPLPDL